MDKIVILATVAGFLAGCGHSEPQEEVTAEAGKYDDIKLQLPADYMSSGPYLVTDRAGQEDQVMVLFANATARDGARTDGKLPNDSILVGEIYTAKTDTDGEVIESQIGRRIPDKLKTIVMMQRRAGWDDQYPEELKVGDWEFEVFSPSGENLGKDTTACRECHHPLTETEFTWSYDHLAGAN